MARSSTVTFSAARVIASSLESTVRRLPRARSAETSGHNISATASRVTGRSRIASSASSRWLLPGNTTGIAPAAN